MQNQRPPVIHLCLLGVTVQVHHFKWTKGAFNKTVLPSTSIPVVRFFVVPRLPAGRKSPSARLFFLTLTSGVWCPPLQAWCSTSPLV